MIKFLDKSAGVRHLLQFFLSVVAVLGILWAFGRPAAEEIIRDHIAKQGYAKADQVLAVQQEVGLLKGQQEDVEASVDRLNLKSVKIETNQETLIDEVKEARKTQKDILFLLQRMNRGRDR